VEDGKEGRKERILFINGLLALPYTVTNTNILRGAGGFWGEIGELGKPFTPAGLCLKVEPCLDSQRTGHASEPIQAQVSGIFTSAQSGVKNTNF